MNTSVGQIVHYVSYGTPGGEYSSVCRAAVVTEVWPGTDGKLVSLCVLNPTGQFFNTGVSFNDENHPGTWHRPERVE